MEILLASRIASLVWRLRRLVQIEMEMMEYHLHQRATRDHRLVCDLRPGEITLGTLFDLECGRDDAYTKFRRYEAHIDRSLFRVLHELERRQMARKGAEVSAPAVIEVNVHADQEAA